MRASVEFHSALAQLVEQMTVNHWVAGSSPAGGATFITSAIADATEGAIGVEKMDVHVSVFDATECSL